MDCTICGKPIVLVPSAQDRAKATGLPASHFTSLFREHSTCILAKREKDTLELIRRTSNATV